MFKANPRYKVPCVKTLSNIIAEHYTDFMEHIRSAMSTIEVVCMTVDMWSSSHRAFIGVTLHWLDEATLKRHSEAIALRRFTG